MSFYTKLPIVRSGAAAACVLPSHNSGPITSVGARMPAVPPRIRIEWSDLPDMHVTDVSAVSGQFGPKVSRRRGFFPCDVMQRITVPSRRDALALLGKSLAA
ncbi:hypothetical protein [Bradyrhizobium embrapense]